MSPDRPRPTTARRRPADNGPPSSAEPPDEIQDAYLRRAIAEIGALNHEIASSDVCAAAGALPVLSSGSPQAQIVMVKWSATLAEQQEGVAFFGRAGSAILKSVQRLGIEPLDLYGTLVVKCAGDDSAATAERNRDWLAREIQIVMPKLLVPMGRRVVEAINRLDVPLAEPLEHTLAQRQRWTPATEAICVPDIDESLDEQGAKREFWDAFRSIGTWYEDQPPY